VSQKNPPWGFLTFSQTVWNFWSKFYMPIICSYLCSTTNLYSVSCNIETKLCHIKCDHPVYTICSKCLPSAEMHAGIFWHFPQTVGNFKSKFYMPIDDPIYTRLQIVIQLLQLWWSYTILRANTQRAFQPMVDILSIWWWWHLIWHNFVKVAGNWIKIGSLA